MLELFHLHYHFEPIHNNNNNKIVERRNARMKECYFLSDFYKKHEHGRTWYTFQWKWELATHAVSYHQETATMSISSS